MERIMVLPEDEEVLRGYGYLYEVEIGDVVDESCGYLVVEVYPEVRDELVRKLDGTVI